MADTKNWYFLPESEIPHGFTYPQSYLDFIASMNSSNGAMLRMFPWVFSGDKIWAKNESRGIFGVEMIPFGQAEDLDMMAYFEVSNQLEPKVWVCDPWENVPELRVYQILDNFDAWLIYAKRISDEQLAEKPHFKNDEFWFPK